MKTTLKTSFTRLALCALAAMSVSTASVHAGSLGDYLKGSAAQGERSTHTPTQVAAVRG